MTVRTLFFAAYRELAGADALDLELPAGARLSDLVAALRARGGGLARLPERPVAAINLEYAPPAAQLSEGDEVALIPPVSGG